MRSHPLRLGCNILLSSCLTMLASCAADPASRPPSVSVAPATLTASDIAERFERTRSSVSGLHVVNRTFENGQPSLTAESWMNLDSVRTEVFDNGDLVYLLSVRGDHAQEYIPAGAVADGRRGPRFEDYTLSAPGSIGSPRLVSGKWACHVGDHFGTWFRADCAMYATLPTRLTAPNLLGVAEVEGARCAAFGWAWEPERADKTDTFRQGATYYVDLATGWLRRVDQYQAEGGKRVERVSLYTIEAAAPAATVFELRGE